MSQKQIRQLIMLGVAGAAIYYLFFRTSSASAMIPGPVTITPINPGLLPGTAMPNSVPFAPGWLTAGNIPGGPQMAGR